MTSTEAQRRTRGRRRGWLIALVAVCVALYAVLVPLHAVNYDANPAVALLLGLGICGAPLLALVAPRIAIAVFCLPTFVLPLLVQPGHDTFYPWPWSVPAMIALVLFVSVVTLRHGWRTGLVPLAISLAASLLAPLLMPWATTGAAMTADLIVTASIAVGLYLVATLVASRIRIGEQLTTERELAAQEQSRRALLEERTRIARELHDVVAHSMSLIQVQASSARYRLQDLPEPVAAEFDDLAATARGSLAEMRRLLGVLRTDDEGPQLVPQQRIADIPELVASTRRAGIRVGLSLFEPGEETSSAVQITAFRIVQEAISNAVRHAPGAAITVDIAPRGDQLRIHVRNDPATGEPATDTAGHGIRGMRERVALVGGTLEVGPEPDGGWSVTAILPLEQKESA